MNAFPERNLSLAHDVYLDWLRGIAALLVLLTHVRLGFFVSWPEVEPASQTILNHGLFFLTRLGHQAVVIFFVLSGYLVGGQAVTQARARRFSLHHYLAARVARLYTVLIPALLLTATVDTLGNQWNSSADGWQTFFLNLFFLQMIFGPYYGTNGPLWTLSFEWWFYVLFGLAVFVYARPSIAQRSVAGLVIALLVYLLFVENLNHNTWVLIGFPLWLSGAAIRTISAPSARVPRPVVLLSIVLLCSFMLMSALPGNGLEHDCLVGAATALLIWLLRGAEPIRASGAAVGRTLAAFSFTLYAVHQPLNVLVEHLLVPHRLTQPIPAEWIAMLILAAGIASCAFAWYWLFERNTPRIRRWLLSQLEQRGSVLTKAQAASPSPADSFQEPPPCPTSSLPDRGHQPAA